MPIEKDVNGSIADQSFENILPQEPEKEIAYFSLGKIKIRRSVIYFFVGGLLFILVGLLVWASFQPPKVTPPPPTPTPTPTPTPIEEKIASPSAYATDSAILRMEGELQVIEEKIQSTDLKEAGLNPPTLDMDVNFED